jgi:hypothetical protein
MYKLLFMKIYHNGSDSVNALHKNGFTNDFQSFENGIWWVQEQLFICAAEFAILEHHRVTEPNGRQDEFDVFGIFAPFQDIKGILINHSKNVKVKSLKIKQHESSIAHRKLSGV